MTKLGGSGIVLASNSASRKAMLEMLMSPEYQASALHREAGLAGQLNIELVEPVGAWLMKGQAS